MIFKYEKKTHMIQCDNREWVSLIECISMNEKVLKSWIIFKAKVHQKIWYEVLKEDNIAVSENDWIDNELNLVWIRQCFDSKTKICQKDEYWMLLIDDHASHIATQMIDYCVSQKIILLCLSTHITHLLQSLDVGVFASLTTAYKTHVQRITRLKVSYSIDKTNFLEIYQQTRHETITSLNIRKSWTATKLLSFSSALVLQHFSSKNRLIVELSFHIYILIRLDYLSWTFWFDLITRIESSDSTWYWLRIRIRFEFSTRLAKQSNMTSRELNIEIFPVFRLCITFLHYLFGRESWRRVIKRSHEEKSWREAMIGKHGRKLWREVMKRSYGRETWRLFGRKS